MAAVSVGHTVRSWRPPLSRKERKMYRTHKRHRLAGNDNETVVSDKKQKRHRLAANDNETLVQK